MYSLWPYHPVHTLSRLNYMYRDKEKFFDDVIENKKEIDIYIHNMILCNENLHIENNARRKYTKIFIVTVFGCH